MKFSLFISKSNISKYSEGPMQRATPSLYAIAVSYVFAPLKTGSSLSES